MGIEFERKFRVIGDGWRQAAKSASLLRQGYLSPVRSDTTVRVRCLSDRAFLAIKGPRIGVARTEFEYAIPLADAEELLRTRCENRMIEKMRHVVEAGGLTWNIDEFQAPIVGLVLAEVELMSPDQPISLPVWVGEEVTGRHEYRNAVLAEQPRGLHAAFVVPDAQEFSFRSA